jgi:hypothetical protein
MIGFRRRWHWCLQLAVVTALVIAVPAGAYQHFSQATGGTGVSAEHWQTLPLELVVDNGPTDISGEVGTAITTWNGVTTAQDVWGASSEATDGSGDPVDFTGANLGTAWGKLTGDGTYEVVFDEDGSALTALGLAPESINGYGPSRERVVGGVAVIDDLYLVVNGSRTDFDRQATEIHELGHTLGLAHSSVGFALGKAAALSPVTVGDVPTMHPYSVGGGTQRRTLEADDIASISELYPAASFTGSFGTITGKVMRCGSDDPVLGANVRAVNVANPSIQLTRVTGFDGNTDGSYTIAGVPPGDYYVVVEPLSGDSRYLGGLAMYTRADTDFAQEYFTGSREADCGDDSDPDERESLGVASGSSQTADLKVGGVDLAFVVDITGSMDAEIAAVREALGTYIGTVDALPGDFPSTAIVTFDDGAYIPIVSRDPTALQSVVSGLSAGGGGDCPESANQALMTAGRLLARNGRAVLATDADSRADGPSRASVDSLFTSKGARLSTILSGSCTEDTESLSGAKSGANRAGLRAGDEIATPIDALGFEGAIRTFSEESLFTGGLFSFQPEVKTGDADAATEYANTIANVAISAVTPAVAAVHASKLPQGTTVNVEVTGSNTNFQPGSTVSVAGDGVTVVATKTLSPTRLTATMTTTGSATLGFRDVTVSTDLGSGAAETATGIGALRVVDPLTTPTILGLTPSSAEVGSTTDVTLSGGLTNFVAGSSVADFGAGVTVNSLSVTSPTSAVANVTIDDAATIGLRSVTVETGSEVADESEPGPFLITAQAPAIPVLIQATPSAGARLSTIDVTLTGANTAFEAGKSLVSVTGQGVEVLSTTVTSPTSLVAKFQIAADAPLGFRDIIATTGGENAALLNGFEVTAAATQPPSGGGGGEGTTCSDRTAPVASLLKGRKGVKAAKRKLRLRGKAGDFGCLATTSIVGRVAGVQAAISRKAGKKRCRWVTNKRGKLSKRRSCKKPVWLKAKGTTKWTLTLKRKLPRGRYGLQVRARDAAGNIQAKPTRRRVRIR